MSQGLFTTMWRIARSKWKSVGSGADRNRTMSRLSPTKLQGKSDLSVARPAPRWLTEPGDSWKIGPRSTRTVVLAPAPCKLPYFLCSSIARHPLTVQARILVLCRQTVSFDPFLRKPKNVQPSYLKLENLFLQLQLVHAETCQDTYTYCKVITWYTRGVVCTISAEQTQVFTRHHVSTASYWLQGSKN